MRRISTVRAPSTAQAVAAPNPVAGRAALVLVAVALIASVVPGGTGIVLPSSPDVPPAEAEEMLARLPLAFEVNEGQTAPSVDFVARGGGYTLFLAPGEATLALESATGTRAIRMEMIGADPDAVPAGRDRLPGVVNYLLGSDPAAWHTNVATYEAAAFTGVYHGIDVVYYGRGDVLEYDFVVAPHADPGAIALAFDGASSVSVDDRGDLVVATPEGVIRQGRPVAYQEVGGATRSVDARFVVADGRVTFDLGDYDRSRRLVIDPTLSWGTFVGGSGFDIDFGIAVDRSGSAYVAGHTLSANFPTLGARPCAQPSPTPTPPASPTTSLQCDQAAGDAFVAKFNPEGTALVYSTYLGGTGEDQAWDVAVDRAGNAYAIGATESANDPATPANEGFPTSGGAFDRTCGTDGLCDEVVGERFTDAFVAKLDATGSLLLYSTYLGGSDYDQGPTQTTALGSEMGIDVVGSRAYAVGSTGSADFPTTRNAFDRRCGRRTADCAGRDGFLVVLDTMLGGRDSLVYSTFIGGRGDDEPKEVATDHAGNAYVAGSTYGFEDPDDEAATINDFPTKRAFQGAYGGGEADAFVIKINPRAEGAASLVYSTYLGGGARDLGWGVDVKSRNRAGKRGRGAAYVVGRTESGDDPATEVRDGYRPYFPRTRGAFQRRYAGEHTDPSFANEFLNGDAFVTKVKPSGRALGYSTFLGGDKMDVAGGVAVDRRGRAYVTGWVTCDNQDPSNTNPCVGTFPVVDPLFPNMDGNFISPGLTNIPTDSWATKVRADGSGLVYSTYLPGRHFDRGLRVALRERDAAGDRIPPEAYYVGRTNSTDFQAVTEGAFQTTHGGPNTRDGYVVKITR